jgi:hypothetical protein
VTLADIKTRVKERLDEDSSDSARYPDAVTQTYITDGIRTYVTKTGCQIGQYTVTQEASTLFYDLPCDCIQVLRVEWLSGGAYYPVVPTSTKELDEFFYRWIRMNDTRARNYFLLGLDKLCLWPISTTGGEQYVVHYIRDAYSGIAMIPECDHGLLIDYAVGRHLLSEGKAKDAAEELGRFSKGVVAAKRRLSTADRAWDFRWV